MSIYIAFVLSAVHEGGLRAAQVVLVLYAVELGASPFMVGVLAATFSVGPMLFAVQTGKLADRFGARWLLLAGAAMGSMGMLAPYISPHLITLFCAALAMGLLDAFFVVPVQSLVGLISTPANRARNYSNYSLVVSTAGLSGPMLAGFSIDFAGHAAACGIIAVVILLMMFMLLARRDPMRGGSRVEAPPAVGGTRALLVQPGIRKTLITSSFLAAGSNLFLFYMPVYAHEAGLSASSIGLVLAANAVAIFAVRLAIPKLIARFGGEALLTGAFVVEAVSLLLIPLFSDVFALAALSFLFGLGMGCSGPIIMILMFSRSSTGRSGEALGLKVMVNHCTKLVSPLIFGAMGTAFGLFPMFWLNALMMGAGGVMSRPAGKTTAARGT